MAETWFVELGIREHFVGFFFLRINSETQSSLNFLQSGPENSLDLIFRISPDPIS